MRQDPPITAPAPADEWLAGWPRTKNPMFSFNQQSDRKAYQRNMGDDTPIQAYSLRDDYERNAEWYPTKTIRDWKTTDIKDEYPNVSDPQPDPKTLNAHYPRSNKQINVGRTRMPKASDPHWGTQLRSDRAFDRSRG